MTAKTRPHMGVLIDTYNHGRFVERVITSILEQDMRMDDVEILVADDAPTLRTPENISLDR